MNATTENYMAVPAMLVAHQTDAALADMHRRFKRTRKRLIPFALNGRIFLVRRKDAADLAKREIASRSERGA
jgi:hypothetical protein